MQAATGSLEEKGFKLPQATLWDSTLVRESKTFQCFVNFGPCLRISFLIWNKIFKGVHENLLPMLIALLNRSIIYWLWVKYSIWTNWILCSVQSPWADLNWGPAPKKGVSSDFNQTAKQLQRAARKRKPLSHFAMQWWHRASQCTVMHTCILLCSLLPGIIATHFRTMREAKHLSVTLCMQKSCVFTYVRVEISRICARFDKISSLAKVFGLAHHATTGKKIWCLGPLHNRQCL